MPVLRPLELLNILNLELPCDLLDSAVPTMSLTLVPFSPTSCQYWSSALPARLTLVDSYSAKESLRPSSRLGSCPGSCLCT